MTILLLDPDQYYQHQFQEHLGGNFNILTAPDTRTAEDLLISAAPDIVVGELMLADGPSYEFLEKTRRLQNSLPIIIFSQINTLPDIEAALALGVSGYFVKGQDSVNDVRKLLLTLNPT